MADTNPVPAKVITLCGDCGGRGRDREKVHPYRWLKVCKPCNGSGEVVSLLAPAPARPAPVKKSKKKTA